ncbi:hypothetical protein [Tautonia rosea]|uniref:hypothetical protein n=1 Tax=Tautonia rosea TaxID=2728037 RepID=UPI001475A8DB|nr:hypothetical protein [Tautonia rosea]
MAHAPLPLENLSDYQAELRTDLLRVALRDGWDRVLMTLGWIHLVFFAVHQWAAMALNAKWPHLTLWPLELVLVLALLNVMLGKGWTKTSPLIGILTRVWATSLIIGFNAVTLNGMTGLGFRWYFLVWAGLATFGFATTAWLCGIRFLIPAVLMYFVGLAMVPMINWSFLMIGVAWWAILQGIGLSLRRERQRRPDLVEANPGDS